MRVVKFLAILAIAIAIECLKENYKLQRRYAASTAQSHRICFYLILKNTQALAALSY